MFALTATAANPDDPLAGLALGDHPEPSPPPGWETVRVRAAALNHHDVWTLRGVGVDPERFPVVLGCDAAGVTDDGREVIVHAVIATPGGDETLAGDFNILSERYDGTFADRVAVPSRNLVDKPAELGFEQAACLPTAYLTAYRMLFTRGELRPGDRVLIQGAGGGVATAAILLARAAGLHVSVTSRDETKLERARELGAHVGVPAGERLPARVDAVLETVGEATWKHSLRALEPGGVVVVAGATSGFDPPADLARVFYRQLRVIGSTMGTREELVRLVRLLDATGVRPLIDDVLPMEDGREAFSRMVDGELFGKLVLTRPA
ncbi:zinc-binding dehydrogenase [Egicoccus halophilus]|uniref:Zn-dependent oxidoreductase n=1 Tax=Egicoccus halophilus TaxID=1670830 RepID=A0A8J3EVY1_9ACTN|nr:zinc-binding dehydrogenase [Egicoccus halophilus]GGI09094.1 Zn-dependent oxidoreductase [Egicoccus halophilus]